MKTGKVRSGDIDVFYRKFGERNSDSTPVLILHGANYYDSYDWMGVAERLAQGREVAAFDSRGYGESGWSANKDYSYDAQMGDILALIDDFGWKKVALMGASRGGGFAVMFASHFPDRVAAVILVDYYPGAGVRHPGAPLVREQTVNNKPRVYASLEAWLAASSRDKEAPPGSAARKRIESFLKPVDGGVIVAKRDPDSMNNLPLAPAQWPTKIALDIDMWGELAKLRVPVLNVTATRSDVGHTPEQFARMRDEFPHIPRIDVDSGHNVADGAPGALVEASLRFLKDRQL